MLIEKMDTNQVFLHNIKSHLQHSQIFPASTSKREKKKIQKNQMVLAKALLRAFTFILTPVHSISSTHPPSSLPSVSQQRRFVHHRSGHGRAPRVGRPRGDRRHGGRRRRAPLHRRSGRPSSASIRQQHCHSMSWTLVSFSVSIMGPF